MAELATGGERPASFDCICEDAAGSRYTQRRADQRLESGRVHRPLERAQATAPGPSRSLPGPMRHPRLPLRPYLPLHHRAHEQEREKHHHKGEQRRWARRQASEASSQALCESTRRQWRCSALRVCGRERDLQGGRDACGFHAG